MGVELANSAAGKGAEVVLITGPTHYSSDSSNVSTISVMSAKEMYDAVHTHYSTVDAAILSAAVADYRPKKVASSKIKKTDQSLLIELVKTDGKASTSYLQRKLQIGYNRAARMIDMMEEDGIVSKANHVGKRDVL